MNHSFCHAIWLGLDCNKAEGALPLMRPDFIWPCQPAYRAGYKQKKSPKDIAVLGAPSKRRRLPTLPHCIAVPSAHTGLTSLFGMGRGGTPPQ